MFRVEVKVEGNPKNGRRYVEGILGGVAKPCERIFVDGILVQGRVLESFDERLCETQISKVCIRVPRIILLDVLRWVLVLLGRSRGVSKCGICI